MFIMLSYAVEALQEFIGITQLRSTWRREASDLIETVSAIQSQNLLPEALRRHHQFLLLPNWKAGTHFAVPRRVAG